MSKWGFVSQDMAKAKFENDPNGAAKMVQEMSDTIIEQDDQIHTLKDELMKTQISLTGARAAEAHLKGYVERVRELDRGAPLESEPFAGQPEHLQSRTVR